MEEIKAPDLSELKSIARSAPESSGVYIMRDLAGVIIYVGKAKVLKNRLSSYFTGRKDTKTRLLVSRIASLEWILTETEYEALLLENELIKRNTPKYNINLKDGKTYPVIRVTAEEWPRVFRTRRIVDAAASTSAPFPARRSSTAYLTSYGGSFRSGAAVVCANAKRPACTPHRALVPPPARARHREEYMAVVERVRKLLAGETEELLAPCEAR
jgi:excinuclease ABC subunit C